MNNKTRVGVLFGGKSTEHEVSILSAKNVIRAIDRAKYDVVLIGMDKKGNWYLNENDQAFLDSTAEGKMKQEIGKNFGERVFIVPNEQASGQLIRLSDGQSLEKIDVFFPVLHGPFGEDGTVQGMLKLLNVAYVGADVLGTSVGMDKDVMKKMVVAEGLPIGDYICLMHYNKDDFSYENIVDRLDLPVFVKPSNAGSSVGISKVRNKEEYQKAIEEAFKYDNKVLVEAFIDGREIECAVLGNEFPKASVLGEIVPSHDFYSYDAKYMDDKGADLRIPAPLSDELTNKIRTTAVKAFQALCHEGLGRVDFFLTKDNEIYVIEINSIPGFTNISMYPQLWAATGVSQTELLDQLIQLGLQRFERDQKLQVEVK
jgi:D-alanine-D-alanine ligase